jgi:hypothetical protein
LRIFSRYLIGIFVFCHFIVVYCWDFEGFDRVIRVTICFF